MKNINKNNLINIACFIIFIIAAVSFIMTNIDSDIFFDLKTGESILKNGIDFKDHFSLIPNLIYMYPHWLYDIIIYNIFKIGSYPLLHIFYISLYALFMIIYFKIIDKKTNNKLYSLIITLIVGYSLIREFTTRVQSITNILLLLEVVLLNKLYNKGEKNTHYY